MNTRTTREKNDQNDLTVFQCRRCGSPLKRDGDYWVCPYCGLIHQEKEGTRKKAPPKNGEKIAKPTVEVPTKPNVEKEKPIPPEPKAKEKWEKGKGFLSDLHPTLGSVVIFFPLTLVAVPFVLLVPFIVLQSIFGKYVWIAIAVLGTIALFTIPIAMIKKEKRRTA
jgi:hypothetical protein